jgi:hypothetical protein
MSRLQILVDRSLLFAIKQEANKKELTMRDFVIKTLEQRVGWTHEELPEESNEH